LRIGLVFEQAAHYIDMATLARAMKSSVLIIPACMDVGATLRKRNKTIKKVKSRTERN
jgi:hypothetical protein